MNTPAQLMEVERKARLYRQTHTATESATVPENAHYAVLVDESLSYDDGYGDRGGPSTSTLRYIGYLYFDTEEALEGWILANHTTKKFKVVHVKPVEVTMKTVIKVAEP